MERTVESQLRAELRLANRQAHEADARATDAEAALLESRAAILRAEARSARANARRATQTAALRHLGDVWKRWFEDAQTGITHRAFVEGIGADLQAVIAESKADGPTGPGDDAWGTVWLHTDWRYVTSKMTTPERECAADAVARWSAKLNEYDGEGDVELEGLRWWRG